MVLRLRGEGLSHRQIGERFSLGSTTTRNLVNDPDGSKTRERKRSYAGVCVDCGGPTDGSNGREKAPLRCQWCAQGKQRPKIRLCVPVRLCDLPVDVRLDAASVAARIERDECERLELLLAAIEPSDTVYWLSESARPVLDALVPATPGGFQ